MQAADFQQTVYLSLQELGSEIEQSENQEQLPEVLELLSALAVQMLEGTVSFETLHAAWALCSSY